MKLLHSGCSRDLRVAYQTEQIIQYEGEIFAAFEWQCLQSFLVWRKQKVKNSVVIIDPLINTSVVF